jgi:glycosyltransferase involved in cell wall biosynthesis
LERPIDLLGVGSLIPLKRYDIFVDVVAALRKNRPAIKAVLCGRGSEEQKMREKIRSLSLEENISLAGEIPHKDVLSMMQKSRILLHPSEYEGYSSACLEALYAGCHVISFARAEERDIDHWHIVATIDEMYTTALALFNEKDFSPVLVHTMENSAREIMKGFVNE